MMTKGEHTYVRDRSYIPSTTSLCEGIINDPAKQFDILTALKATFTFSNPKVPDAYNGHPIYSI